MKRTMKKTIQLLIASMAGFALTAQIAWADVNPAPEQEKPAVVVESYQSYKNELGTTMVPLRVVAEALGFQLTWNDETHSVNLVKGDRFTTVYEDKDAYFYNSMEPVSLNGAATNGGGTMYVPLAFFREILQATAVVDSLGAIAFR
ncbi:copper amine oxidase N-terminal domain-containing protein [Paenibacillus sp. HJGM_3]|uniref:copper amine oxidase N-terminal domain-containing protein n=1 Tax=Paenibacillus sp. HJGM_3 TaxID=3379816 RepID=UPI00385B2DAA